MSAWTTIDSPVGELLLTSDRGALTGVFFENHRDGNDSRPDALRAGTLRSGDQDDADPVLQRATVQLREYFAGERRVFDLVVAGHGTPFQKRVWDALVEIPYGRTASYADIARRIGLLPSASRAVGTANGSNPVSIVVPCHRVIGADGSLTGYGGGLERKRFLLDLERDLLF